MKNKHSVWIIISLLAVFALGTTAGVFGERYFVRHKIRKIAQSRPRFPSLEIMAKELELSQEQQDRIRELFRKNEEKFKELRSQMHRGLGEIRTLLLKEIKDVLNQEQRQAFEAMLENYMQQRKQESARTDRTGRGDRDNRSKTRDKGDGK